MRHFVTSKRRNIEGDSRMTKFFKGYRDKLYSSHTGCHDFDPTTSLLSSFFPSSRTFHRLVTKNYVENVRGRGRHRANRARVGQRGDIVDYEDAEKNNGPTTTPTQISILFRIISINLRVYFLRTRYPYKLSRSIRSAAE